MNDPTPDTPQAARAEGEWLENLIRMAEESIPPPVHPGSCSPETACDMDCANRYYSYQVIGEARLAVNSLVSREVADGLAAAVLREVEEMMEHNAKGGPLHWRTRLGMPPSWADALAAYPPAVGGQ
jgi:hypothetical protein